jgi:type I restriction enzyme M protein
MALKKSQLYSSLWSSCDELRGGMDASQYKDYVLTLLFVKYVSDKYAGSPYPVITVPPGGSFDDIVRLKGDKRIGDKINIIIGALAEANDLAGVIDQADFNDEHRLGSGKEMQDRLSRLVAIFHDLDLRTNRIGGDDLLGDAYEYLMRNFATESGKSKGQFYTPAEVSLVMAKIVGIGPQTRSDQTVYDPTCGSGSLLLKAADEAPNGITIYGQEMDLATWSLARMNMILHGYPSADIWRGNTLSAPRYKDEHGGLKRFDFAVCNPPFSAKAWTNGLNPAEDEFERFAFGIPPEKNGDFAFLLHLVASLRSTGKGAIILPHGVLFRGHKEADIRRALVQRGYIKGIIGLPPNLFYGTGIPACIVVIDKAHAHARKGIFLIDASKGFMKDGNKNRLRAQDIHKIVDVFTHQTEVPRYSRMVPLAEIANPANDYNLNIPRYIDSSEPEDEHDLDAHLNGGIPARDIDALAAYWEVFPTLRADLFAPADRPGYVTACVATPQIKATILAHPEFQAYTEQVATVFEDWKAAHAPALKALQQAANPKAVIADLSEDLLVRFASLPLLNRYDVYQRLMDYWAEVMQDDVYLVADHGWCEAARPRDLVDTREKKVKEAPDLTIGKQKYKMDLLPPSLIVERYFEQEQAAIVALQARQEAAAREIEEFVEEHTSEDGLLEEATTEKGSVTRGSVRDRLKAIQGDPDSTEEREALNHCLALMEAEAAASKAVKDAQAKLDAEVLAQYTVIGSDEDAIKTLVVDDKWLARIQAAIVERYFAQEHTAIQNEVQRLTQTLATRVKVLEERYAHPLPELEQEVQDYSAKVAAHLKQMGLEWE